MVVVAFVERGDTVLMEHRADCDQWCLIGGRMERDQSVGGSAAPGGPRGERAGPSPSFSLFGVFSDPSMIAQYDVRTERVIARVISLAFRVQVDDFGPLQVSPESTELRFFTHDELRGRWTSSRRSGTSWTATSTTGRRWWWSDGSTGQPSRPWGVPTISRRRPSSVHVILEAPVNAPPRYIPR